MKFLLILVPFLLAGCTTVNAVNLEYTNPEKVTLEELLRSSYMIGCLETTLDGNKHDMENEAQRCEDRSHRWDPNELGLYRAGLRLQGEK